MIPRNRTDVLTHLAKIAHERVQSGQSSAVLDQVAGEEVTIAREKTDVLARVPGRGDDFETVDDISFSQVIRPNNSRAGRLSQRLSGRRVIGVAMGDENRAQLRHRLSNGGDVRVDRRTGIDYAEVIEQICPGAR